MQDNWTFIDLGGSFSQTIIYDQLHDTFSWGMEKLISTADELWIVAAKLKQEGSGVFSLFKD